MVANATDQNKGTHLECNKTGQNTFDSISMWNLYRALLGTVLKHIAFYVNLNILCSYEQNHFKQCFKT